MKTPEEIKKGLRCCFVEESKSSCSDCPYANYNGCTDLVGYDAIAYINQLENQLRDVTKMVATAPAPTWISVENSLPSEENVDKFLVVFERRAGRTVEMARYMNGRLTLLAFEAPDGKITHWMPLPEPQIGGNSHHDL